MKHRKPLLLSAIVAAFAALATPITAFAGTYEDTVKGVEIYASSTRGIFTGTATGRLPGSWTADVRHTELTPQPAKITGGTFSLTTTLDEDTTLITGVFKSGGKVVGGAPGCGIERYLVDGDLEQVGPSGSAHIGTGHFNAILTHYRVQTLFFGCVPYGASIAGTVSLTF